MSAWAVTVPSTFYDSLESGALGDGSLARFLIFRSDEDYPDQNKRPAPLHPLPQALIDGAVAVTKGAEAHDYGGELAGLMLANINNPTPYTVPITEEGQALLDQLSDELTGRLRQAAGTHTTAIIGRLWEHSVKCAMIRAISDSPAAPVMDVAPVAWGIALAEHCVGTLIGDADRFIADNEVERDHKRVLRIIEDAGPRGISLTALTKKTRWLGERRKRLEILATLGEAGAGDIVSEIVPGASKPTTVYRKAPQRR
jgi:hypothetical protein